MYKFKYRHIFISAAAFSFIFANLVMAHNITDPLVPCGGTGQNPCGFNDIIHLIQHVMTFLLVVAAPVAALLFAYAGFQYVFAAGNEGKIEQAHKIFWTAFLGLVFMASAWLVVKLIVTTLGSTAGSQFLP